MGKGSLFVNLKITRKASAEISKSQNPQAYSSCLDLTPEQPKKKIKMIEATPATPATLITI